MPTLLYYALTTEPFPLQASAQSGNLTIAQLTIVATNATAAAVSLQGIIVQLPVGSDAAHLTPTEDAAAIGHVPPANWKLEATQHPPGFVQYLFYPVAGQQTVAAGQSLTFIFNNVAVNRTPGTCELIVTEGSNDCQPPACPTANLYLTKFPNGWGQVSFWADPNIIACDASTTLYWSGPAGATYTIDYYTSATGPVHVPAAGQPALSNEGQYPSPSGPPLQLAQNTTFYLSVVERINNQTYSAQQQATVTVELPQPTITSFTGQLEQVAEQTVLVLNWQTAHADYCHITGDPHLLSPNSTDSRYRRHITPTNPLLSSYTLTATNTAGQVEKQLNAMWVARPIAGFWQEMITSCVAFAPDCSYGLATASQSIFVLAIKGDTISVAATLTNNDFPTAIAFLPDGTRFYVLLSKNQSLQAYDAATYQPIGPPVALNNQVDALVVTGGARPLLFVATEDQNGVGTVAAFDPLTLKALGQVAVGAGPRNMAASPAGDRLYVSCELDGTVWTLNLTSNPVSVLSHISVGNAPLGIGVSAAGTLVVVACEFDNTVWVLDAQTTPLTLIGSPVTVGSSPWGVAVSGNQAFVVNNGAGNISTVEIAGLPPVVSSPPLPIGGTPTNIAVTNNGLWLLVSLFYGLAALTQEVFT